MSRIVVLKVGENPEIIEEKLSLDNMQKLVGGYIERIGLPKQIDVWINEEGKLNGSEPNFALLNGGMSYDIVCGNAFFCSHNDEGDSVGLTDEQIKEIYKRLYVGKTADRRTIKALEVS